MATIENQLMDILNNYEEELGVEVHETFKAVGKETAVELKDKSQQLFHHKSQRHYADGWTSKLSGNGMDTVVTIYNKLKPGLTHLLENGHMILINGINHGRSREFKHIEPAEKQATNKLIERLSK